VKVGEGAGRNSTEVCCEKEVAGGQRIFIRGLVIIKSLFFSFANLTHSLSAGDSALYRYLVVYRYRVLYCYYYRYRYTTAPVPSTGLVRVYRYRTPVVVHCGTIHSQSTAARQRATLKAERR
jgi:hypothetical protein